MQEQQSKMLTEGLDSARREVPQLMQVELTSYFRELSLGIFYARFQPILSLDIIADCSKVKSITVEIKVLDMQCYSKNL